MLSARPFIRVSSCWTKSHCTAANSGREGADGAGGAAAVACCCLDDARGAVCAQVTGDDVRAAAATTSVCLTGSGPRSPASWCELCAAEPLFCLTNAAESLCQHEADGVGASLSMRGRSEVAALKLRDLIREAAAGRLQRLAPLLRDALGPGEETRCKRRVDSRC